MLPPLIAEITTPSAEAFIAALLSVMIFFVSAEFSPRVIYTTASLRERYSELSVAGSILPFCPSARQVNELRTLWSALRGDVNRPSSVAITIEEPMRAAEYTLA